MAGATRASTTTAHTTGERTNAQWFAYLIGAILVVVGIIGFLADGSFDTGNGVTGDKLLGLFEVNGIHNLIHIASGAFLLAVAPKRSTAKAGVLAFGVIYGVVTIIGLIDGEDVLGLIPVNGLDNVLHIILTAGALLIASMSPGDDDRRHA
jgi:hypothetical protein